MVGAAPGDPAAGPLTPWRASCASAARAGSTRTGGAPSTPRRCPSASGSRTTRGTFDTVEINNTFYRLPSEAAVKGWVEQTPDGFAYAVKASRYLTHVKKLKGLAQYGKTRLFNALAPMNDAGKLAVVLWQLPPNFHRNDERLRESLEALPEGRHAFEFRHPSWFCDDVYALLQRPQRRAGDRRRSRDAVPGPRGAHG